MVKMRYSVIFEKAESNWAAHVPDLPETRRNIREAIEGHVRTPVPEPRTVKEVVEVRAS
jgi:predicted RNase H-like HicB family nuclease